MERPNLVPSPFSASATAERVRFNRTGSTFSAIEVTVDLDRAVVGAEAGAGSAVPSPVPQGEDVGLKTVEQAVLTGLLERLHLVRVVIQEQPEEVPPLLAAGGQQAVAGLQVQLARIPVFDAPGDLAFGSNLGPELPAGVEQEKMDVQALGQPGEDLELRRRQRRDTEEAEPGGQPTDRGRRPVERGQETLLHPHPVDAPDRPDQLAPEGGVPGVATPPLPV